MRSAQRVISICLFALLAATFSFAQSPSAKAPSSSTKAQAAPKASGGNSASKAASQSGDLIDINSAGKQELMTLPGVGEATADKIIAGRPYKMKSQLKSRKIVSDDTYSKISDKIIAKQKK